ncbi:27 kDa hemolymph protein-like [Agrilus planipennis]|uniref:27 kDa hemolymph protein-like n=1 Tax=Agrilus planipennis TaxID=224129 RepID=A0A1W4WB54_AGRPL|nr:27 kDa hemolymph protein-like [Agrilus planipennis]
MKLIIFTACLAGLVLSQNEDLQDLTKRVNEIPGFENFNQSSFLSSDTVDLIKQKCEKNGGEANIDLKFQSIRDELQACISDNFNVTQIQEEVEKAKSTGSMDEVFAKYCAKKELVYNCVSNLTETVNKCLDDEEKESMKLFLNVTDSLANFVCFKDGDRIAMFIAEGGVECLNSQNEPIQRCVNETFGYLFPQEMNINSLPKLIIKAQHCSDFTKLQKCVVEQLENCKDNTPANIVDALFKFIRRVTPCKNQPTAAEIVGERRFEKTSDSSSTAISITFSTILIFLTLIFSRYV